MTRVQTNAITWLQKEGYKPVMGGFQDMHHFELMNKDSGHIEFFDIDQVLNDYKQNQKDETRMREAEKRNKNTWHITI